MKKVGIIIYKKVIGVSQNIHASKMHKKIRTFEVKKGGKPSKIDPEEEFPLHERPKIPLLEIFTSSESSSAMIYIILSRYVRIDEQYSI